MKKLKNDLLLRTLNGEKTERTPIWVMRQAGRYLPEYRAVRAKSDFITMCKTPELATEVTIQPVDIIGVDAAILFSDILVIPEAMGLKFTMDEGTGPVFPEPIRNSADLMRISTFDPSEKLKYVTDAVKMTVKELNGRVPLIGFSGAPWTLLTYMVEGRGSKNFAKIKEFVYSERKSAHKVLEMLTTVIIGYLKEKVKAGADAVQVFDTWGSILSPAQFEEFSKPYITRIVEELKPLAPVIVFAKGVNHNFTKLVEIGANAYSVDWTVELSAVKKELSGKAVVQGNLDPTILYAPKETIKEEAERILASLDSGHGHIFNLGHGILPDVKPEHLKTLVDYIKNESSKFHD
ncbi:MAG: uroporphyrinogen decarboxylase [Ignavibacteriales bacterium]|nr:MAG: uroporphyrinogen decarboxylase [Ignavibacteriaceae bacterium]MBW7871982.1 uroporphyrinogen decarboxylase [Ignavibacteria bacterium]MCZ2144360.1 uroporphyrinogen decarboxylase [Ignavibacteriales bacterium]OQY72609.1 MAG: uroporphyrinogen decarboxylase [Ignavibacteriales bacterium UTCHB3]MBV6446122.1 Uroporphyrinogen decarboxylase [Ignavibacteriaceae bacterium]